MLPFDNLGGDPEQTYFSDGLSEDLITALSRFRDLVVLARHSSFALRGETLGAVEIGRRLGVRSARGQRAPGRRAGAGHGAADRCR